MYKDLTEFGFCENFMKLVLKQPFNLLKILTLAPIDLKILWSKNNGTWRYFFANSKVGFLYNILLICVVIIMNITATKLYYNKRRQSNALSAMTTVIIDIFVSTNVTLILISLTCQRSRLSNFINRINQAKELALTIDKNLYEIKNTFLIDVTLIFLFNYVTFVIVMILYKNEEIVIILEYFMTLLNTLIASSTLLQYCCLIKILRKWLTFINDNLMKIFKESNGILEIKEEERAYIENKFDELIKFYDLTHHVSQKISSLYSFPIFFSVSVNFLSTTYGVYFIIKDVILSRTGFKTADLIDLMVLFLNLPSIIILAVHVTIAQEEVSLFLYSSR